MVVAYSDNLIYNKRVDRFATEKADSDRPATLIHRMNTTEVFMIKKVCPICGQEFVVESNHKKQIYCSNKCKFESSRKDITGQRFGKWTVISFAERRNNNNFYLCKCDCGNERIVQYGNLTSGASKQCAVCGDKQAGDKKRKHFGKGTRLYRIWENMRVRCTNSNNHNFKNYGGRGITICPEWDDFVVFQNWALQNDYADNLSIDRIDVNGNYEPSNCRWVTQKVQSQNTRRNHNITINGETHCISEWARIYNIKRETIKDRIKKGWDEVKAVITPKKEIICHSIS